MIARRVGATREVATIVYMKRVSVAEARNNLPALIYETETEPIEIMRRGKPVAVLVSRQDFDRIPPQASFYEALWRGAKSTAESSMTKCGCRSVTRALEGSRLRGDVPPRHQRDLGAS